MNSCLLALPQYCPPSALDCCARCLLVHPLVPFDSYFLLVTLQSRPSSLPVRRSSSPLVAFSLVGFLSRIAAFPVRSSVLSLVRPLLSVALRAVRKVTLSSRLSLPLSVRRSSVSSILSLGSPHQPLFRTHLVCPLSRIAASLVFSPLLCLFRPLFWIGLRPVRTPALSSGSRFARSSSSGSLVRSSRVTPHSPQWLYW